MFAAKTLIAFTTAALAISVTANPVPSVSNSCNTAPVQCCEQLYDSQSKEASLLSSLIGIQLGDVIGQIGSRCSPIGLVGIGGGTKCSSAPVCCTDNTFNGLVSIGCTPINAVL